MGITALLPPEEHVMFQGLPVVMRIHLLRRLDGRNVAGAQENRGIHQANQQPLGAQDNLIPVEYRGIRVQLTPVEYDAFQRYPAMKRDRFLRQLEGRDVAGGQENRGIHQANQQRLGAQDNLIPVEFMGIRAQLTPEEYARFLELDAVDRVHLLYQFDGEDVAGFQGNHDVHQTDE